MASLRDADITTNDGGGGIIKVLKLSACVTGDTITTPPNKGVLAINRTTSDAISASYSASTGLTTVTVANTPDIMLWVLL